MADCTKTVEFLREIKRMCLSKSSCYACEIKGECGIHHSTSPEEKVAIVQKWSDEHPVMTWAGKLKELLPNVEMSKIIGTCCPYNLFGGKAPNMETCRSALECIYCWDGEYKEAAGDG